MNKSWSARHPPYRVAIRHLLPVYGVIQALPATSPTITHGLAYVLFAVTVPASPAAAPSRSYFMPKIQLACTWASTLLRTVPTNALSQPSIIEESLQKHLATTTLSSRVGPAHRDGFQPHEYKRRHSSLTGGNMVNSKRIASREAEFISSKDQERSGWSIGSARTNSCKGS